jgi:hypothetical protein
MRAPRARQTLTLDDLRAVVVPEARARADNREVTSKRKRAKREADPLAVYRRIRKPIPPPERIVPDKRRELEEDEARREIEEDR